MSANITPDQKDYKNYKGFGSFKLFVLENFPFIAEDFDALTYYQMLCKVVGYLQDVITNNESLQYNQTELLDVFNELQNYVNTYFDNLDVQTEINNKLDQMAQDGTLQEIIGKYLNTKSLLGFDNVSDMINSENLIEGSFAQTFGFNSLNDGGTKKYKIIKEQNAQNVNGRTKINLLHDDLYAISLNDKINVREYGAKGDGITDDTEAIQFCIDNFPHRNIYIPNGEYLISAPISIKNGNEYQVNLILEDNAIIKTNTQINALLEIGKDIAGTYERYSPYGKMLVQGGVWDATNTTYAIYTSSNRKFTIFKDLYILNVANYGIYIDRGTVGSVSSDARLFNITISGNGSDINPNAVGLYLYSSDNEIDELRIQRIKKSIVLNSGGDLFTNLHLTGSYSEESNDNISAENYNDTTGIEIINYGSYYFTNLYIDTLAKSIVCDNTNASVYINNMHTYFWKENDNFTTSLITFLKMPNYFLINGGNLLPPTKGVIKGINIDNLNANYWKFFSIDDNVKLLNITTNNPIFDDVDNIKNFMVKNQSSITPLPPHTYHMIANSHYAIATLREGIYTLEISMGNDQIINAKIVVYSNIPSISIKNIESNAHINSYTLELVNPQTDIKGNFYCDLAIKSSDSDSNLNPVICGMDNKFSNNIYKKKNVQIPLTNPTILATASFNP